MNIRTSSLLASALLLLSGTACADPVIIDTPEAKILVIRPVDRYSTDESHLDKTLSEIKKRQCNYYVKLPNGRAKDPLRSKVQAALGELKFSLD